MSAERDSSVWFTHDYLPIKSSHWNRCYFRDPTEIRYKLESDKKTIEDYSGKAVKFGKRPTKEEVEEVKHFLWSQRDLNPGKRTWLAEEIHHLFPYCPRKLIPCIAALAIVRTVLCYLSELLPLEFDIIPLTFSRHGLPNG